MGLHPSKVCSKCGQIFEDRNNSSMCDGCVAQENICRCFEAEGASVNNQILTQTKKQCIEDLYLGL